MAKVCADETAGADLADSPALSDMAARQGVIPGAATYMTPEQAKEKVPIP